MMDTKTVCSVGCLMSSTSMGLSGTDIKIKVVDANPGTLNEWLRNNDGTDDICENYSSCTVFNLVINFSIRI